MRNYVELGPTPLDEECVQVSLKENYEVAMKTECNRFKNQLLRMFPPPFMGTGFGILRCSHNFGPYYEVIAFFNDDEDKEIDWALGIEENLPLRWI